MKKERTIFEKLIISAYYILLVCGVVMLALEISASNSFVFVGFIVFSVWISFKANNILESERKDEEFEKYWKNNDKK